jgi:tRNA pseudouridine55 synthase
VDVGNEPFGFINALKPPGPTSTSFGGWVRRSFGGVSVGHWGTLDPAACGVLVLAVGTASRLLPYLSDSRKRYVFELRAGSSTDTGDATGRVIARSDVPAGWAAGMEKTLLSLTGRLEQIPPMFSAVKIGGKPLYKAARAGRLVERALRTVEIHALACIDVSGSSARLSVECSAGTYVRTLCEQIGERLGVQAHLGMLLRTRAGPFDLRDACTSEQIGREASNCLTDPAGVVPLDRIEIDDPEAERFSNGNPVRAGSGSAIAGARERDVLVVHSGRVIGVGRLSDALAPVRVLCRNGSNP